MKKENRKFLSAIVQVPDVDEFLTGQIELFAKIPKYKKWWQF